MTEQLPPAQYPSYQPPQPAPIYAIRTHAELTWQDVTAFITGWFTPLSVVAIVLGLISFEEAKKIGLKQHALGMVGIIGGALGSFGWVVFWFIIVLAGASAGH